jgi:L-ascorbate metabolism protein UlaG (beta-lactamase superfamily)
LTGVRLTHIGGPTVLIEVGGWRLLTDPIFDPPGGKYSFERAPEGDRHHFRWLQIGVPCRAEG